MLRYILKRLFAAVPVMAVVALAVFSMMYAAPGNPAAIIAGDTASAAEVAAITAKLGLDRPFLERLWVWVFQMLMGDFGSSIFSGLPVTTMIGQAIEPTIALTISTTLLAIVVAIPMGVIAAWRVGTWIDRYIMLMSVAGFSVPVFLVSYILVFTISNELQWLPVQGYKPIADGFIPFLRHITLPTISLGFVYIALIARMTRAAMLDVLSEDYIRTARAKGLAEGPVLFIHALKNAAIPIATVIGIGIAFLIGGVVVTESVFAIPGLGRLTVDSVLRRDYPVIQAMVLFFAGIYVIINLLIDLSYALFDPRVRY
ncbi:ABC transporter permease [Ferrovibrio sp.]|uniref:ABC transporter permease n=1 Tax=Ferrovibrio sp. TaxID=1917215 RepID=UPI0026345551|nr:ABC transporter permease [Ferrovibrio sp.]